jgi:uncharacterized protein YabE (DUF348 family)
VLILGFGILLTTGFYLLSAQPVTVFIDETRQDVRTHQSTVAGLLAELRSPLDPQDIASPGGDAPIQSGLVIHVKKAHLVIIDVDGQRQQVLTQSIEPRDILSTAKISIGTHDLVEVDNAPLAG